MIELAPPPPRRWQPLRAGLVDLFLYDQEEFRFRDGKLLLRGNNGTGKSKVLALMLPFLLDADLSPHRVEPDGDRGKRMEWNLLMGDRYDERLGYTWLELRRVGGDGAAEHLTLGCGIKAVAGRGVADHWFFITTQRIGRDLSLLSPGRTTLTRERLTEAIGAHGHVYKHAESYKRAVDERLFHFGETRYNALVNLLIQLRQPQLSKRPDPDRLSAALSEALTPVDVGILSDVAAAFHDLERQRNELTALEETREHVTRFLARYRHYARVASRRQAAELRQAHARYEDLGRQLAGLRTELAQAEAAEQQAATKLQDDRRHLASARVRERELSESRELRDLAAAGEQAQHADGAARKALERRNAAIDTLNRRTRERDEAGRGVESSRTAVNAKTAAAARAAEPAGLARAHTALLVPLELPDGADESRLPTAERSATDASGRREQAVRHVLGLVGEADRARHELVTARQLLLELEGERDRAAERLETARSALTAHGVQLAETWRRHVAALVELGVADWDAVEQALLVWVETLDGANPASVALQAAANSSRHALAEALAAALGRLSEANSNLVTLRDERDRLLRGETERPPAPYTRAPDVREGRAGAPLWQVVDFRDHVSPADRAGLEAALEASGLLDAWVTPDGRLLEPGTHDVIITAGSPAAANLAHALLPAVDRGDAGAAAIGAANLDAVLAGIGLGAATADTWVEPSGRWRLGVAEGQWAKPAARFIGRGAREAARRQRLAELVVEIAEAESAVRRQEAARDAVRSRQRALEAEVAGAPSEQPLRNAHAEVAQAERQLRERADRVEAQQRTVHAAAGAARQADDARDEAAADLSLPTGRPALEDVRAAVSHYRVAVAALWPDARRHLDRLGVLRDRERDAREAAEHAGGAADDLVEAKRLAAEAAARRDALIEKLGATVDELRARLEEARQQVARLEAEEKTQEQGRLDAFGRAASAREGAARVEEQTEPATRQRDAAVTALQRFGASGLLPVALPGVEMPDRASPWAAGPAVRLARQIEQELVGTDAGDDDWGRAQRDFSTSFRELGDALRRHNHQARAEPLEDRYVVTIEFGGHERRPDELAALLADEVEHRERMLSAREREVLEEHLVNEVASHLQELISAAEAQVERMNDELERRPTSTGMRLRFRWQPDEDGPAGLPEARRRLLRQVAEAWSPEDRAAVSAFLHGLIAGERARNEIGTWLEHLVRALDYRAWHRFKIERWQDGRWRPATGPASGGERVLTVTLPLFAAASSHYR
ncbi:MAG TPA: TIGR02680 family protein, partial [Candidatus Dormibacteraeota bacterium]